MKHAPLAAVVLAAFATTQHPALDGLRPPELEAPDAFTLRGSKSFEDGYPARNDDGSLNAVIEIPAGDTAKWEVDREGVLRWEQRDGEPRVVKYLGYPGNYGMVPRTLLPEEEGGDGDPLDVLVLDASLPRGSVVRVRALGVLRLTDGGERDDKILAVREGSPLASARDLADLDERFPGVTGIVAAWFTHYKGPGEIEAKGFGDSAEAERVIEVARRAFDERHEK